MSPSLSRRFFMKASSAGALIALHPFSARAQGSQAHLRILSTTDIHCHIYAYDYYGDKPNDTMGLARTASLIEAIRAEAHNSILLDNGDYLQGNPLGDYIAYEKGLKEGDIHPVTAAMNALGYDGGTLGNHEFNYGMDYLHRDLAAAKRPVVCANFATKLGAMPGEDDLVFQPYTVLERNLTTGSGEVKPIKIGLIGFVPPQVMQWDAGHLAGKYEARDIIEAARYWVPKLRAQGVDIVVAMSHSGLSTAPYQGGEENASYYLADIEGIDAHRLWPSKDYEGEGMDSDSGKIKGVPAVMAGFWGSHMGLIDLQLDHSAAGWKVIDAISEARAIYLRGQDRSITPTVADAPALIEAAKTGHEETLAYVRAEVGKSDAPLYSYFAQVADDPSVQIVSLAQMWYVGQLLKGTKHEGLPLLSAAAPFKAGGRGGPDYYTDVPAGPIAIKNVADLYLYPNTVQVVRITGAQVKEWLERSAGMFNQITAGSKDQPLLNPEFAAFNYDTIDGVNYLIDLSQPSKYAPADGALIAPEAERIKDLSYNGQAIDPAQEFIVATNNYRASGGGNFPGADGTTLILAAPDTNRDVIVRYILEKGSISPGADNNWRFAPMPGTQVLFETGPKAKDYLAEVQARGLQVEEAGEGADGFIKLRLSL